ncbi:CD276 antigen homolog isoform X2 [Toxotes jaculatrix]|uniref:CD276 antigen homolog isoform X2 n=1 Tax=Toxotes jaculatrix TaxID=941984 RepID=UPI001B3AE83C|nr:CD276 antigen homolog isoform X2 [Toxotes jaculatrix]
MALLGVLFIFSVICISTGNAGFVVVQCSSENVGQYGQQSLLECVVRATQDATDTQIRVVTWKKEGDENPLLLFHKGQTTPLSGYKFAEPSWDNKNMNVSLLVTNTVVKSAGIYTCMVATNSGDDESNIRLKVTAKYSVPVIHSRPEKITRTANGTLICDADGGYPQGEIHWFVDDKTDWAKGSKMEVTETENGLFNLTSELPLLQGSNFSKYTCVVFNASGGEENEFIYEVQDLSKVISGPPASKIVPPVVIIGSLIVGLPLALLICRRRNQRDHQEVAQEEADHDKGGKPTGALCGEPSVPLRRGGNHTTNHSSDTPVTEDPLRDRVSDPDQ